MKISVIAVGKIKEKFYREALAEYAKRLGRYCTLEILEVPDEKTPEGASAAQEAQIREKEGRRVLAALKEDSYAIALAIQGKPYSSEQLSAHLDALALGGKSHLSFLIGGSLGLSEEVLRRAEEQISFSAMTFPHPLMRVILLEQIYRSFRISRGEPYHK